MKRTNFLLLSFIALTISLNAQSYQEKEVVIIRIIEFTGGMSGIDVAPVMHITENDGSYRIIELDKHKKKYLLQTTDNQSKIQKELKKYIQDGYEIVNHTKGAERLAFWFEDYVLVKD